MNEALNNQKVALIRRRNGSDGEAVAPFAGNGHAQTSDLFKNQIAMVSGGLGDIGVAIVWELARHGAAVAIGDVRSISYARNLLADLKGQKVPSLYQEVDVADADAVQSWVEKTEQELGVPSLIVPNAATATTASCHQITAEAWSRELRVNLDGAFYLAQAATKRLLHHKLPGRIVFLGSWAANTAHRHLPAYCVSKAGLRMLCKCMALELAPHGILVNEVAPGFVDGGVSRRLSQKDPASLERSRAKVPVLKLITPQEVAQQVVHLCHPANQHMTGSTLLMDGGLSLLS